jgi:hypothetical protein
LFPARMRHPFFPPRVDLNPYLHTFQLFHRYCDDDTLDFSICNTEKFIAYSAKAALIPPSNRAEYKSLIKLRMRV